MKYNVFCNLQVFRSGLLSYNILHHLMNVRDNEFIRNNFFLQISPIANTYSVSKKTVLPGRDAPEPGVAGAGAKEGLGILG